MSHLSTLDLLVVALYIAGTTLLGAWFARGQRDVRTYFVGDRNVSWWLVLVSIVATETSTVTFLSVPGLSYKSAGGNLTFLQLSFGYIIGRAIIAWFLLPQFMRGELFSAYQVLRERFGPGVQRFASGLFLVTRTIADGLRLFLTALLLQQFTGLSIDVSIVVTAGFTLAYTYLGGMQAVIWTDLIQFIIYVIGAVLAGYFLIGEVPGGIEVIADEARAAGKLKLIEPRLILTEPFTFWAGVIGGAVFTMASHGADQLMVQRYLCSRSLNQARAALVLSGFVVLLQFSLFLLIGIGLHAVVQHGRLDLSSSARPDEVFGAFIVQKMPSGLMGLVIAAVLAAAMSTLSSSLNSSATAFVSDFYRPQWPDRAERHYLGVSRGLTMVFGVAQTGIALITQRLHRDQAIVNQVLAVAGYTTGLVLGLFLLGSLRRRPRSSAALIGLCAGAFAVAGFWIPAQLGHPVVAWPWFAPIGAGVTALAGLLANLVLSRYGPPDHRIAEPGVGTAR
jgi:SSS family transporter